jgi:hypothetical protein
MIFVPEQPYQPWKICEQDFPCTATISAQASFLIHYALLAANSHNTQPWKFHVEGNRIDILPDFTRALPTSDPLNREFFVSIGWALGNLLVAAEHFGFSTNVRYYLSEEQGDSAVISVFLEEQLQATPHAELFPWIVERRMNRHPYKSISISKDILEKMRMYNDEEPQVNLAFVTKSSQWDAVLDLVEQATLQLMADGRYMKEWLPWMRSIYTRRSDGLTLFDFGFPGPLTLFAQQLFKYSSARAQADGIKKLFATAPIFLVVSTTMNDQEHWLRAGKVLAYVSLAATKYHIAMAPWGAVIEHEETSQQISQLLQIPRPVFFARMGYTDVVPHHSPRRPAKSVLV